MALPVEEANAASTRYFDPVIRQQAYDSTVFLARLKKDNKMKISGGTYLQFPVRYQKLEKATSSGPRAQFSFESKETRTAGELPWKYYHVTGLLHWDERNYNSGKQRIINLVADKSEELVEDFNDKLATDIFAATQGTNDLVPLSTIVDATTTYAGIAVADAAEWKSTEDSATTTLVLYGSGSLAYMCDQATFGKYHPTLHITTRELKSKAESLIEPQKRYQDKETADMGFENVTFHGKPIVGDPYVTAGSWYGLDMKQFELGIHTNDNFDVSEWFSLEQAGFPKAMAKYITMVGNIISRMRKTHFKFTVLDYTL